MDLQLRDRVIIVTGGANGIGLGISGMLAAEGAIPVIIDRDEKAAKAAVSAIEGDGGKAGYITAELTNPDQCRQVVATVVESWGGIYGLVNNAGVNDGVSLEEGTFPAFVNSLHRNLSHYFLMAHYALPELKKARGAIVNISSKVAVTGQGGTSGYAAANGGRNALTREWAVELLPYEIRVNAVVVAECYTPLYEKWLAGFKDPGAKLKAITQKIPLQKRMTTAAEIAGSVAFLLSPVSGHTTGQLLYVDGGYTHLDRALT
jgi:L-fucose dehydrogenase